MNILVGYSGFVGSNLDQSMFFDLKVNSRNVQLAFQTNPDICVYAAVKSQKFIANNKPDEDFDHILESIENIKKINPRKLILISTIDVLDVLQDCDEDSEINIENLKPYGKHRRFLEEWVVENINDYHIVRLPALYGENLKKNFIFDIMNPIPSVLPDKIFLSLINHYHILGNFFEKKIDQFYYLKENLSDSEKQELLRALSEQNFSSLHFTDSRSVFQFYPLKRLAEDLSKIIEHHISCIQLVTESVKATEVYELMFNDNFVNEIYPVYPHYNLKTRFSSTWNRYDGYLMTRDEVLEDLKTFIKSYKKGVNI